MKEKKKNLGPGEGYERGFTRTYILKLLLSEPEGITESDLRDNLREELGVRQRKNVTGHLEALLEEGLVLKKSKGKGKSNVWKIEKNFETLKKLAERFCNSGYATDFIKSKCTQAMIEKEVKVFLNKLKLFSKDQVKEILTVIKISPSALHLLLDNLTGRTEKASLEDIIKDPKKHLFVDLWKEGKEAIRERVISALQVALAYDGANGRAVSEEFNKMHFDIKTTLEHPEPHPNPVTLSEARVDYPIFERKETLEKRKRELKEKKEAGK